MNRTMHNLLFALTVPALAMLAACDREAAEGDYAAPAAADTAPVVATTRPEAATPPEAIDSDTDAWAFAEMDTNQDGGIAMDELSDDQMLHQHFSVADADGDGVLSEAEVDKHRADMGM
ncbi:MULTISPECIES: hypothetical protein [Novilysobacter]|uniref:hypothetical protein n=1 Tax=Novilysobacter TaxID=3382699 RepID=UPI002EDAF4F2